MFHFFDFRISEIFLTMVNKLRIIKDSFKGVFKGVIEKKFKRVMMYQGKYSLMLTKLLAI